MATKTKPPEEQLTRLTGIVIDLHPKSNDSWSRAKVQKADGFTSWVTAKFAIDIGETLDAHCTFNATYKSYDVVSLAGGDGKVSNDVVVLRLVQELSGVGAIKARRLGEKFDDLYETITKTPTAVAEECGVDLEEVQRVAYILDGERETLSKVTQLVNYGYPGHIAKRIAHPRAIAAWKVALESPYRIIKLVDGLGWLTADEVGRKNKIPLDSPDRIQAGIDHYYREKVTKDGHTKVTADGLLDSAALPALLGVEKGLIADHLDAVLVNLGTGYYTSGRHRENAQTIASFFGV